MKTMAAITLGVVLGLGVSVWWGSTAPVTAGGSAAEQEAARLYQQAAQAVRNKQFRQAAKLFEKAYEYDRDPSLLVNAAEAHEADLNDATARIRYWEVLTHPKATTKQKAMAREHIARLETRLRKKGKGFKTLPMPVETTTTTTTGTTTTRDTSGSPSGNTVATTTTTTQTQRTGTGTSGRALRSGDIVRVPRPDVDEAYMLSAMHCRWDGPTGRFMQCSSTHAWGGAANFDITPQRTTASSNGLTIGFQNTYKGNPYCSVEFKDIAALRRVDPAPSAVTIWLHNGDGGPKNWNAVRTWVTVVCHGVD